MKPTTARPARLLWALGGVAVLILAVALGVADFASREQADAPETPAADAPLAGSPQPAGPAPDGMVWVPGGTFWMGEVDATLAPDATPRHRVDLDGYWIDRTEVTNAQFARFVEATKYVTDAEKGPPGEFPAAKPGSVVFTPPDGAVSLADSRGWWSYVEGACWKHPEGPQSSAAGRESHPVVHVSWNDAAAYCAWAGKRLPTEAEWECAARGGLDGKPFAWGDDPPGQGGHWQANIWQGHFPDRNERLDGFASAAPVMSFPPNGYGLYDVSGNVWEWCADWYRPDTYARSPRRNPKGPPESFDPNPGPGEPPGTPKRVMRGGSFLCNDSYCVRYRPGLRGKGDPETGLSHTGFRCVKDAK